MAGPSSPTGRLDPAAVRAEILAEVNAEDARIAEAQEQQRTLLAEAMREAAAMRAEWRQSADAARDALQAAPEAPEVPDGQPHRDALSDLLWRRSELVARRHAALGDGRPRVESAWQQARPDLDERARDLAGQVQALAEEYAAWHRLVYDVRYADEHRPNHSIGNGASERMRPRPTPADVLLAASGTDLCGVRR